MYSVSSRNALDLLNSSSSSAFQAASLFFLRSSDMYAYFASQLNSAYYILNLWQSHHRQIFLEDHSPVNRWQYILGFCRLSMYRNCIGGSHHLRFMSHTLRSLLSTFRVRLVPQSTTSCLSVSGLLQHACFSFLLLFLTWTC